MKGSEHNDPFEMREGKIRTTTNNSGGVQGGISNGEDICFALRSSRPQRLRVNRRQSLPPARKPRSPRAAVTILVFSRAPFRWWKRWQHSFCAITLCASARSKIESKCNAVSGSPLWQTIFLSFAFVLILFEMVRGWRLGVMRQFMRAAAIVAAYFAAIFRRPILLPMLRPFVKLPDIVLSLVAGAILAFIFYFIISTIGAILFKRTWQQSVGAVRLLYGISGAVAGIFFGLFTVWLVVIAIRSLGAVADAQVKVQAAGQSNAGSPTGPETCKSAADARTATT